MYRNEGKGPFDNGSFNSIVTLKLDQSHGLGERDPKALRYANDDSPYRTSQLPRDTRVERRARTP